MSSTSIDQLVQLIVTRHDSGPSSASVFRQEGPRFDTHLRQAESVDTSPPLPAPAPQADADRNDSQQRGPKDVDRPVQRSAESDAPSEDSTARTSNEPDQHTVSANDAADAKQDESDQAADAEAVVGEEPTKSADEPTDTTAADEQATDEQAVEEQATDGQVVDEQAAVEKLASVQLVDEPVADEPVADEQLADEQVTPLAENDDRQESQQDTREAAPTVEPKTHAERTDAIVVTDTAVVEEASDISADVAEADEGDVESRVKVTANKRVDDRTADSRSATDKLQHEQQSNVTVARGETAAGLEPAAVGVKTIDTGGDELSEALPHDEANSKLLDGPDDRSQRTLSATAGQSEQETASTRQSVKAEAVIGDGEQLPTAPDAKPANESAAKPGGEVAADNHDQSPEKETQVGRPRPTSGVRANSVQPAIAASVDAKLAAEGAAAVDATGDSSVTKVTADTKDGLLTTFGRLERNGSLGTRAAHRPGGVQETPHVDPARFISRVARAIHAANERGGPLHLRLSPPELGSLRLELSLKQGVLTASVETDTTTARQVLLDNLPALRDRLAEQSVRIERFDVDVRRDGSDQQQFGTQDREDQQQDSASPRGAQSTGDSGGGDGVIDTAPVSRTITDTSINVIA